MSPRLSVSVCCMMLLHALQGGYGFAEDLSEPKSGVQISQSGSWKIAVSENFSIRTQNQEFALGEIANQCEELRTELRQTWIGSGAEDTWTPRCEVILHPSLRSYTRTLGTGVGRSVGCASLNMDNGRVVQRRIDLRLDNESWMTDALPHELTHVVLADRFTDHRIPPWIDEGIGVLSESRSKQQQRMRSWQQSKEGGIQLKLRDLLELSRFPAAQHRDAFYGQSATLVRLLQSRSEHPSQVLDFADHAVQFGYDSALRKYYQLDGVRELSPIAERYRFEPRRISAKLEELLVGTEPEPVDLKFD